jgi:voltage-gated potassium channel
MLLGVESRTVHDRYDRVARRFDVPMLIVAALVIPAVVFEESNVGKLWNGVGVALNWVIWLAFAAELVVLLTLAPDRRRWLARHPLDVAIVLLTGPFLPSALQAGRLFRLVRVVRLFRLTQLSRRVLSTRGLKDAAVLALAAVLVGGLGFAAVERGNQPHLTAWDGIWWAITTVTTVGYGDVKITTTGGRIIGIAVMLAGIGFVALLTAAAAQRFMRGQEAEREELLLLREVLERLERLERKSAGR